MCVSPTYACAPCSSSACKMRWRQLLLGESHKQVWVITEVLEIEH